MFRPLLYLVGWLMLVSISSGVVRAAPGPASPIVFTQVPSPPGKGQRQKVTDFIRTPSLGEGGRIVVLQPDGSVLVLSKGFESASDPDVSFDGTKILFAGRKRKGDNWNIYEMSASGADIRQITRDVGNCRSPVYQSRFFTLDSPEPWFQITFVSDAAGEINEVGELPATSLYSCRLDGSGIRRLTFNPSSDFDPFLKWDGILLFSSWQRSTPERGPNGRISLFGINQDGTDLSIFSGDEGHQNKRMPTVTSGGWAVFVESETVPWDGSGQLGRVSLRRNLHSYRPVTAAEEGLFHSPSPLPDGRILVSRRSSEGTDNHGIYSLDPETGTLELIYDSRKFHDIQAKLVSARTVPDGRSSVVDETYSSGQLYCLNTYISDLPGPDWLPPNSVRRVRVLEGVPRRVDSKAETVLPKRVLGDVPVEADGSFFVEVPAGIPIQLQTLDENGLALRTCSWIWVMNRERRGCIGCHEDGELTPENRLVEAVAKPPVQLTLPVDKRRTVDFTEEVLPILSSKCRTCHEGLFPGEVLDSGNAMEVYSKLTESHQGSLVKPGEARNSALIWHLLGRRVDRPWDSRGDDPDASGLLRSDVPSAFTELEKRILIEWIDLGAHGPIQNNPGWSGNQRGETP